MTRKMLAVAVVSTAILSITSAADNHAQKPKVDLKKMKATIERLENPVTLEFIKTPLSEVIKFLEDYAEVKLDPERATLPDKTIQIHLEREPFGVAIEKILSQCDWTYAVRPDGSILLRPVAAEK